MISGWRARLPVGIRPYLEAGPLAAACLGMSSGFAFAMIAATLTTRLAQYGISRRTVTAFGLTFLVFSFKFLWSPLVDSVRLPFLHRYGQRRSWLWGVGALLVVAVVHLGQLGASTPVSQLAAAAIAVSVLGATFDIVVDAYRIELLTAEQLGVGAGMHQYGWRVGSAASGGLALVVAARYGWSAAYLACTLFVLPAMLVGVVMGEPARRHAATTSKARGVLGALAAYFSPLAEFLRRRGAVVVLTFVLIHKVGDTLANLTLRLLFAELGFSNDEIAFFDVGVGFITLLAGVFVGGWMYASIGMKRSVFVSLVLMAVSNVSFAALAAAGHSNVGMAAAIGFENFASGIGGVAVVAYLSALCNLRFTATQYALLSALAGMAGRFLTSTTAGALIDSVGFVNFYLLTTVLAVPGVVLYGYMVRTGLADVSLGTAGRAEP